MYGAMRFERAADEQLRSIGNMKPHARQLEIGPSFCSQNSSKLIGLKIVPNQLVSIAMKLAEQDCLGLNKGARNMIGAAVSGERLRQSSNKHSIELGLNSLCHARFDCPP